MIRHDTTTRPSPSRSARRRTVRVVTTALAVVFPWAGTFVAGAHAATHTLTCGPERAIGQAIKTLKPGDTLLVSGTCNENLEIGEEIHRITLDGQGTAIINGDASANAITVRGSGITIRGFVITGGAPQGVAIQDGGTAVVDRNTIRNAARNGIAVFRNSSANIVNNRIEDNGGSGIAIQQTATGRIGWSGPPDNRISAPNIVQHNGAQGVQVTRGSSAQIFSGTIQHNGSHGVLVDRNSQLEVAACTITGNAGDGIRGMRNSEVDIGTDATGGTPQFDDDTNVGTNAGFAVRCIIGGIVDGRLGGLAGVSGGKSFAEACIDSVVP